MNLKLLICFIFHRKYWDRFNVYQMVYVIPSWFVSKTRVATFHEYKCRKCGKYQLRVI